MLVPTPGGRRAAAATAGAPAVAAPAAAAAAPEASQGTAVHGTLPGSGLNPLVRAANPLLDLVVPLRLVAQPPDLHQLRERLALAIKTFESEARAAGVDSE